MACFKHPFSGLVSPPCNMWLIRSWSGAEESLDVSHVYSANKVKAVVAFNVW